jgi:hypothetical protein
MSDHADDVQRYLDQLTHPRHADIARLREAILAADPGFSENVKWNAPNFVYGGIDRVTFQLHPGDRFLVVLHRGAVTSKAPASAFEVESTLVTWVGPDRGVVDVPSAPEFDERLPELLGLIGAWVRS